ncbi:hypothetical protein IMY05_C4057000600 [Salix suchowensis]|nr:hypothetical protein IMY05_C5287000300 [Salix suchowensis]KAG5221966.1 hypothetical protein IMY05_C4057000600 [Salix suchowensis]
METKLNSVEDRTETGSWFKPKKGSVLPGKKMSVKRKMFGYMVRSVSSPCSSCFFPPRPGAPPQANNEYPRSWKILSSSKVSNADCI